MATIPPLYAICPGFCTFFNQQMNEIGDCWRRFKELNFKDIFIQAVRVYNLATAIFVFIGYLTTKNASAIEYFGDIAIHLFQASLSPDSNPLLKAVAFVLNPYRLYDIFERAVYHSLTTPYTFAVLDIGNHCVNLISSTMIMLGVKDSNIIKKKAT